MDNNKIIELVKISKDIKILYVEDDPLARSTMLVVLNDIFQDITTAVDGQDGLDKFNNDNFNLILTDINMPKLNGIEMIEAIRETDSEIPILILSASNETDYFTQTIKLGIDGYLLKPIEMPQLIETLLKTIHKIKLIQENKAYKDSLEQQVKERTEQIIHQTSHDILTGKKNQVALIQEMKENPSGTMIMINIDSLKQYNEMYGMDVGNIILKSLATMLDEFTYSNGYELYRVYGDSFVLYNSKRDSEETLRNKELESLVSELHDFKVYIPALDDYLDIDATVSMTVNEDLLLEKSEIAMSHAKDNKSHYCVYNAQLHSTEAVEKELYWRSQIKEAIKNDNIIPVFQPIVNRDQKIIKYEVLMRMVQHDNDEIKLVSPIHFLETSIKTKQYKNLTQMIITKSFKELKDKNIDFSINLSFQDIQRDSCSDLLKEFILKYDLGKNLIFEIVESEYIKDFDLTKKFIATFRELGVRIAIDDFGTGYSNFSHIIELKPDYLKIDGSLIKDIVSNPDNLVLVKAIVQFSKELNIKLIAEFVCSKEIFDILLPIGIDEFQGFYFSEPIEGPITV